MNKKTTDIIAFLTFSLLTISIAIAMLKSDYIIDKADSICGLESASQLTNPALVDYDKLLAITPEIRKMKKEKIKEDSAKGIQLRTAAEKRVSKACKTYMKDKSHCSIWKKIKRKDGKKIPDITNAIKRKILARAATSKMLSYYYA
jgi:hypothetical protein